MTLTTTKALLTQSSFLSVETLKSVANNAANTNVPGYKKTFSVHQHNEVSLKPNVSVHIPKHHTQQIDFSQGPLQKTDNSLHAAIGGEGFFVVQDAATSKRFLTRNGTFYLRNGNLVTSQGYHVQGTGGNLSLDPRNAPFHFNKDGSITGLNGAAGAFAVMTVQPQDLPRLTSAGEHILFPEDVTLIPAAKFEVYQGFLERSNVITVQETVNLGLISKDVGQNRKIASDIYEAQRKRISDLGRIPS